MSFGYGELFFGQSRFCCCIPARVGVAVMTVFGIILSALLSFALWYQISGGYLVGKLQPKISLRNVFASKP